MATAFVYNKHGHRLFRRWNRHQVTQHLLVVVSFITLVVTGLPLRAPGSEMAQAVMRAFGGAGGAGIVHRIAAVVMMLGSAYHLAYLVVQWRRGNRYTAMWPGKKDLTDLILMMRYFVGLVPNPPRFHKYGYIEKFEYWAMAWGTVVMVITGFMLWFPTFFIRLLTPTAFDIAKVVHGYEAVLAALAILVWHFYHAHWKPCVFPMSKVWLNGLIDEHELKTHHPLEYERIVREGLSETAPETETYGSES